MTRRVAALARRMLAVLAAAPGGRRARVLVWHGVGATGGPLAVTPDLLAGQLDALLAAGAAFDTAGEVAAAAAAGRARAPRAVALTFDDGLASFAREAVPELARRGLPASVFVVTAEAGGVPSWPQRDGERIARDLARRLGARAGRRALAAVRTALAERLATWDELAAAAARGVEVLPHSRRHRCLDDASPAELDDEIGGAVADLRRAGFPAPAAVAWPYGVTGDAAIAAARRAGLAGGFLAEVAPRRGRDPFRLDRVPMEGVRGAADVRFVLGPGPELRALLLRR